MGFLYIRSLDDIQWEFGESEESGMAGRQGAGMATILPDVLPLLLMAAVTLPTAAWLFRNRLV